MASPLQIEALKLIAKGRILPDFVREEDGWHARWRALDGEGNPWIDDYVRRAVITPLTEDAEEDRYETLHDAWAAALRSRTGLVRWDDAACAAFAAEIVRWQGRGDDAARRSLVFTFNDLTLSVRIPRGRRALRALGEAAYVFGPLRELRRDGEWLRVTLRQTEAEGFVRTGARDLMNAGYTVEGADLAAEIHASVELDDDRKTGDRVAVSRVVIRVAGEVVTAEEIRFLLEQGSSLVFFRNRWIEVDRNILRTALRVLERTNGRTLSRLEALSFSFGIGRLGALVPDEVRERGWLRGLVASLRAHGERVGVDLHPEGLVGTLRPYQRRGAEWLAFLTQNGFGALLADDMGLGKTIQTIAWLLHRRTEKPTAPALVVAPLTLLANWRHEFAAFAPDLRVSVHQGANRSVLSGFRRMASSSDVVLTSYALLVRDYRAFSEFEWDSLVVDEAQAIKNPETKLARAVKGLAAPRRIALTGTPIENSVADIWSIEEFLNPGFLGSRKDFSTLPPRRIRHAIEPFLLRRLKSDPAIACELGEKREIREYCVLTPSQRADYERALEDFRTGEHRAGDVFALLTTLKLVCDGEGKLARLFELLESIFEAGESVLVFSQYAKVGAWLREQIAGRFGGSVPFLHGGLNVRERERAIADFNRPGARAFILSLRAGGFGLNLTKATHVVHFDRWWNPAVENQATDRAHRIGQTKTVFSHLFITEGTLEEHVDEILRRKSGLAETIITEAEWLAAAKLDE